MQSCINIACQGQDYVNIVNADATLRQDANVAWGMVRSIQVDFRLGLVKITFG